MSVDDAIAFRNKDIMKARVAAAGIRTPKHRGATSAAEVRTAAEEIGYPLIIKPIDGAGSMDTFRVDDAKELDDILKRLTHIDHVNVEEFIEAEEFTFDTVCINGEMQFFNVGYYRPRPLTARQVEWISPQTLCLRDVDSAWVAGGRQMGADVLKAMNPGNAFTHMEWYRKSDGEVVFGEIAVPAARRAHGRPDELRLRHRSLHGLRRGGAEGHVLDRGEAEVQRDQYLQASPGARRRSGVSRASSS